MIFNNKRDYDTYLGNMFADIQEFCRSATPSKLCKILVFLHGGLNTRNETLDRAAELTPVIKASGSYPLFVNWDSGFVTSYRDHLRRVYKGINDPKLVVAAPFQFGMDEGNGLIEAPAAWFAETRHTFTFLERMSVNWKSALGSYTWLQEKQLEDQHLGCLKCFVHINEDLRVADNLKDDRTWTEKAAPNLMLVPTLPTKLLGPPLIIQALGHGAWDVMYRRTATLFTTEREFNIHADSARRSPSHEMPATEVDNEIPPLLYEFIDRFEKEFIQSYCNNPRSTVYGCKELELTLVGHSMGSIIIDQWLRKAPELEIRNIVYMAGATSVVDYRDTVYDYLAQQQARRAKDMRDIPLTDVYHLVLHPTAEIEERGEADLAPRGSLLVWIDNYFSRPVTPLDRTLGRFFNLMPELARTPEAIRSQIHVKVFRVGKQKYGNTDPQIHGDFSGFPFWEQSFWDPTVPLDCGPRRITELRGSKIPVCPARGTLKAETAREADNAPPTHNRL